ncbi:MAG: 16S rRNA processing protein RimM [Deltaproteobacteria bacterium HGW-Deltaproteobacteria-19]|jgi:16S rRNA processing protein RimM|nr:MAG: 16S rRNA processing protein RimM [Deltaproteobacteria bacterium HGW-Deltaproteobacteria-19]
MRLLEIGRIVKPHGLKGSMKVLSFLDGDRTLKIIHEVYIGKEAARAVPFRVKAAEPLNRAFSLTLEGIEGAEQAAPLLGFSVWIPADRLEKLPDGEYYWWQIIGLEVRSEEGQSLGFIEEILPTGSNDVYVCRGGEREILLPAIADVIREIDTEKGFVTVRILEGL